MSGMTPNQMDSLVGRCCDQGSTGSCVGSGALCDAGCPNPGEFCVLVQEEVGDAVEKALDRDTFLTAEGAKKFGLVDHVIEKRPEPEGEAA